MMRVDLKTKYKGKKVLITGGLGLIGSTIANKLVALGAKVTILDAMLPLYGGNFYNIKDIRNKVQVHVADIRDEGAVNYAVRNKDIIFNLAGQVSYVDSNLDPLLDLDINCRGHITTLEAIRKYNPKAVVVFAGSRMQYGKLEYNPVDENHPMNPLSIYGVHKLTGEKYYTAYNRHHKIKTICFRIANPYGPRSQMKHSKYSMINWFIRMAMENQVIKVFGEGLQIRDYIYVDDIADGMIIAAVSKKAYGEIFNIGSGRPTRFIDMVKTVIDTVGSGSYEYVPWPENYEKVETGGYVADITKLKKLGWKPKIDIKTGIKKTYEYYKKNKRYYFKPMK